jgi:hypothetical protein
MALQLERKILGMMWLDDGGGVRWKDGWTDRQPPLLSSLALSLSRSLAAFVVELPACLPACLPSREKRESREGKEQEIRRGEGVCNGPIYNACMRAADTYIRYRCTVHYCI